MFLEVEPNPNVDQSVGLVYKDVSSPREVYCIKYFVHEEEKPVLVTGWDGEKGMACPAYACRVEESGDGMATLIFGGSGGIRMKELEDEEEWDCRKPGQWGETHLSIPSTVLLFIRMSCNFSPKSAKTQAGKPVPPY